MVNKVAFIIPTYPPHFNYAKNFLDTFRKNYLNLQADLFLFSLMNQKHKNLVNMNIKLFFLMNCVFLKMEA